MYLKRLEIQGFKSFANKTVLEFEKGITAVVGPNGSGKSNVADAIRWVLGEQSLKQLRGKKSEDVIFAGSEKRSRQSFAQVTVTFDNKDRKIPIDYSEVSFSRSMDRSGESDYFINANRVRLLDIVDLILKANIGTSRHTVIGQGTIDQMILAGPGEVKNLLDEASGVKGYYMRREKTLKRLETTTQNLMRVQDLLSEIEPRLKSLRRQAKKMEERANIEQELKMYQAEFFGNKYWQVQESIIDLEQKIAVLETQKKELQKEIDQHRHNLDKNEGENKSEIHAYQEIQVELKKLLEQKNKMMEDIAMIRGKLQAEKSVGGGDAKALNLEKSSLESEKNKLSAEISSTKKEHSAVQEALNKQQALFNEVSTKLAQIQAQVEHPEQVNFQEFAQDVAQLDEKFEEFYQNLERASDVSLIISFAQEFKSALGRFKSKASKLSQNPFSNFEKQRQALNEILSSKDSISQELNSLELKKSKLAIKLEYLEAEAGKIEQKLLHVNLELQKTQSESVDDFFKALLVQETDLNDKVNVIAREIIKLEQKISEYHASEQGKKKDLLEEERMYRSQQDQLSKLKDQESVLQIEKAKLDTQKDNIIYEGKVALGPDGFAQIVKEKVFDKTEGLEHKISKLRSQLDVIGGIDELTLKEYQETDQRYTYLSGQVQDLQKGIADLRSIIEELDVHIKKQFNDAFTKINEKFENYFRILFNGGRAYLSIFRAKEQKVITEAENSQAERDVQVEEGEAGEKLRPEEKVLKKYEQGTDDIIGIDIKATPPGKKLASISSLSGGERSLTSIALLCSLLSCFPSPFVMLDEVDAALDEANTIRFAQILGTLSDQTQFITVTHNRETMRQAHTLYGVTMGEDSISKILSIKVDQAQVYAK